MNTEPAEKPKLSRGELLAKARKAKADKARAKLAEQEALNAVEKLTIVEEPVAPAKKAVVKPKKEVKELPVNKKELEPEIIEEVVRVPANRRKKIVKRTIEIEESETDEEIVEEVVKIPKIKKEVKVSRDEMKKKLVESNKQRLHNELFS
jgi:hypothetical protein